MADEKLGLSDYRTLAEFRYQIRRFLHFSEQQARACGIEPQQHQLLLAIKGLPEGEIPTIATLAARLQLRHHTVVELVDRLETNGFVEREHSSEDRREVLVHPTRSGEEILHRLTLSHHQELETAGPLLVKILRKLIRVTQT